MLRPIEIAITLQKLAIHTPPLVFHCGRNVRGYLKYEPAVLSLGAVAAAELNKVLWTTTKPKIAITKEEYIYAYMVLKMAKFQIEYLREEHAKRMYPPRLPTHRRRKSSKRIPLARVSKKYVILPSFFAYQFDSGVQYLPTLLELFTLLNSHIFDCYFGYRKDLHHV